MRPYLSYSQLALYLDCPLKYRFRYIDEIQAEGVSSALVFGKAIHQALAQYYTDVMDEKPFWLTDFLAAFEEAWWGECEGKMDAGLLMSGLCGQGIHCTCEILFSAFL